MSARAWLFAAAAASSACARAEDPPGGSLRVVVRAPGLPESALDAARLAPEGLAESATRVKRTLELRLAGAAKRVTLSAPEACPLGLGPLDAGARELELEMVPLVTLSGPLSDVGFGARFEVSLRPGCAAARRGSVRYTTEGAPLAEAATADGGFRFVGRTGPAPPKLARAPADRVVPVSAAERATTRIVARWTSPTGDVVERSVDVSAAPRSRGLPNVALGERILLGGTGYHVRKRPERSLAEPMPWGPLTSFLPDAAGRWELARAGGPVLSVSASRYDAVPLDCGRSECHATESHAAQDTPMTFALRRLFEAPAASGSLACAFGCHTTGEPGAADGGFSHALADLEHDPAALPAWNALPRSLRRLGGVGCLGCHGPGQVPEPSARWAILRADVCAYCHDAPPRYGHVEAWRRSAMALADDTPAVRASAACARCHTTWGFLDSVSGGRHGARFPPDAEPPMGIACAACHAVHDANAERPGLLRRVPLAADFADLPESAVERSSACIACHAPADGPGPSSALIWAGRGARDPVTELALVGPAPHAAVPGGCVGCHGAGPEGLERGSNHAFRPDPRRCARCHAAREVDGSVFDRARRLLGAAPTDAAPAHANPEPLVTPRDRALGLARLVLEDRGAAVHNPRYASALLDRAESVLSSPPEAPP